MQEAIPKPASQKNRASRREQSLNIIYFVDSSRTHSFKLSVNKAIWLTGALGVLVLWTFMSSIWLFHELNSGVLRNSEVSQLMSTIFDYQTRYDQIYERTYPKELQEKHGSQFVASEKIKNAPDNTEPGPGPTKEQKPSTQVNIGMLDEIATKGRLIKSSPPAIETSPITIEKPLAKVNAKGLTLSFAIKNRIGPDKAEGRLWGLATFMTMQGKEILISSPANIDHKTTSIPNGIKNAPSFSIRYYKSKSLFFNNPIDKGFFTKIDVYCAGQKLTHHLKTITIDDKIKNIAKNLIETP